MPKEREHRRPWSPQQDDILREIIESDQTFDKKPQWKKIALQLSKKSPQQFPRNSKQCRQRWYNALNPAITEHIQRWGLEEDIKLVRCCKKIGRRWSKLVKQFDYKITDNRLKNHFYSNLRKFTRHLSSIIKQQKSQYNKKMKNSTALSPQYSQLMKKIIKIRGFDIKDLTKIFNIIDSKQENRYEVKKNLQIDQINAINQSILDVMEDFLSETQLYSNTKVLSILTQILDVNKSVKAKYTRESKMSLDSDEEIQKHTQLKKKKEKQINCLIKEELNHKIIPNKQKKQQILQKYQMASQNQLMSYQPKQPSCYNQDCDQYHSESPSHRMARSFNFDSELLIKKDQINNENLLMGNSGNFEFDRRKNSQDILQSSFQLYNGNAMNKMNFSSLILERSQNYQQKQQEQMKDELKKQEVDEKKPFKSTFLNCITIVEDSCKHSNRSAQNQDERAKHSEGLKTRQKGIFGIGNLNVISESQGYFDFNRDKTNQLFHLNADKNIFDKSPNQPKKEGEVFHYKQDQHGLIESPFMNNNENKELFSSFNFLELSRQIPLNGETFLLESRGFERPKCSYEFNNEQNPELKDQDSRWLAKKD